MTHLSTEPSKTKTVEPKSVKVVVTEEVKEPSDDEG
jgi:hypothetical protein